VQFVEAGEGELASGRVGKGRMAEPERIVAAVEAALSEKKKSLQGKRFLVTAGATVEAIDPVRFISNHSTGKMGYALAEELAERGAEVTLVSGRTNLSTPKGVKRVDVLSAEQMYEAAVEAFEGADGAIMCAAVADYTPAEVATSKIKKSDDDMSIRLKRTKDIAASLGAAKGDRLLVGFALETDNETINAESKLAKKNFDFIVLNSLREKGAGFGVDTNRVSLIDHTSREELPLMSKREVAGQIIDKIEKLL
jgi:phosphopantothenoylcysteine decarboxylase/phosphopantothenate--cysteine ligase